MTMMARVDPGENIAHQKGEKLKRTRVEYLVNDLRRMGIERPKREVVEKLVNDTFRGSISPESRHELVDLVMAATRPQQPTTGDEEAKVPETTSRALTTERVTELATEYLKAHPEATAAEVMQHVQGHGHLPMKPVSFKTYTVTKIRKELGIDASANSGHPPQKAKPKKSAPKKPTKPAEPKKEAKPEPSEEAAPIVPADQITGTENHDHGAAPETFRIVTPAGELMATRKTKDGWQVSMDAAIETDTLAELVRDLVASLSIDVAEGW